MKFRDIYNILKEVDLKKLELKKIQFLEMGCMLMYFL